MIEGPGTLVSTVDSGSLSVTYKAVCLTPTGGTYVWSITNSTPAIEIVSSSGSSATVRSKANMYSGADTPGDQVLQCVYTVGGNPTTLTLNITVARPTFALDTNGGTTSVGASILSRTLIFQLKDQYTANIKEKYSYTNSAGSVISVRVINLQVSEQLSLLNTLPSGVSPPAEKWNQAVSDSGTFSDTHSVPRNVEIELHQWIMCHVNNWTSNNFGFGNVVRQLKIEGGISPYPDKIRIFEWGTTEEIPEQ